MDGELEIIYTAALARYLECSYEFVPSHRELAFSDEIPEQGLVIKYGEDEWLITRTRWFGTSLRFRKIIPAPDSPSGFVFPPRRRVSIIAEHMAQIIEAMPVPAFYVEPEPPTIKFPDIYDALLQHETNHPPTAGPAQYFGSKPSVEKLGSCRTSPLLSIRERLTINLKPSRAPPACRVNL